MNHWKKYKWGDLATLEYGKGLSNYLRNDGIYPVYGTNGKIGTNDKYLYPYSGIIIGRKGAYRGVHFSNTPFYVIDTAFYLKPKSKDIDIKFSYYQLLTIDINLMDSGSAIPSTSREDFYDIDIFLPPLQEQIAIAEVLCSLDDKIDLLHRQSKILEQLTESLYRQWFVEEAEEDWKVDTLGNVFDIGIGRTPPRKEQHWFTTNPNDVKWVSIKDMGINSMYIDTVSEYLTEEAIQNFNIPIIPGNTVILSFKMTIGRLAITNERMLSNEAIAHFKRKDNSNLFPEFLYLFLKTYRFEQLGSTSSIVEAINSQMIKKMEILIPDNTKIYNFEILVQPFFEKIKINQIQIRTLTKLRDTILPKLMSGEVRVKFRD